MTTTVKIRNLHVFRGGSRRQKQNGRIPFTRNAAVGKMQILLKRESDAATRHAKIIVRAVHHVPAEITHPTDMRGEANLETRANLAKTSGCAAGVCGGKTNRDGLAR